MQHSYNVERFKETFESEFTYLNGFMRNVFRRGNEPALICPLTNRTWTYKTLNDEANRLASSLMARGVTSDDVVMHALLNSAEFVFTYIATHKIGCVNAPLNYRLSGGEIALLIDQSKPKALIYDAEFEKIISEALRSVHHRPEIIIMADLNNEMDAPEGVVTYRDFVKDGSPENPVRKDKPSIYDETTRFFTSGTTNLPKAVPVNDINEVLSAHDVIMHFPLSPKDVTMNLTPWFHRGGLHSGGPCPTLYIGGTMVILRDFTPRLALQYVSLYHITFLIGAPTVIDMLCRIQETNPRDISSLHGIVLMGSPLDKEPCKRYMKVLTPNIFNGYGTTETFWNVFLRPYDLPDKAGYAGGACTDDDVRVVRVDTTKHVSPDELVPMDKKTVGEVVIFAPNKSTFAYYDNPKTTEEKFHNGWLYTGDLATWDEHAYITIIGRKDDMIVSAGENIYPVQVESILNEHPKVAESLVFGIPDPKRGSVIAALIRPSDPSLTEKEMKQFCMNHPMLAPYKRPRIFRFVKELPHNATGKLLHKLPPDFKV